MMKNVTMNMMVKNEERYIRQTLRSTLPHVQAAIIVDTGSDDKTYEYAEEICAEFQGEVDISLYKQVIAKDSRLWDGNHSNQELTNLRNQMLSETKTDWVWQVDGDEIYTPEAIQNLTNIIPLMGGEYIGVMVPIKWCVDDEFFVSPGPFDKTLRIFPRTGVWQGQFPDEYLWVNGVPITINDTRCVASFTPFLHMSMALHPERRPPNGRALKLTDLEQQCLNF